MYIATLFLRTKTRKKGRERKEKERKVINHGYMQ